MNKFLRFYNQNRYIIWISLIVFIGIIVLLQILNRWVIRQNEIENSIANNTTYVYNGKINNNYSVITEKEIETEAKNFIDTFISYCKNSQIQNAYNMLSNECRELIYPTIQDFVNYYYREIFTQDKDYVCQAWVARDNLYIYRIDFIDDMLATGKPAQSSIVDYYTVVKNEDGTYKLNISELINTENLQAVAIESNVTINVKRKAIYMNYETYDIEIINNSNKTIMLDGLKSNKNLYIEDTNEGKRYWNIEETLEDDITLKAGYRRTVQITFNKKYTTNGETIKMVFADLTLDNESKNVEIML